MRAGGGQAPPMGTALTKVQTLSPLCCQGPLLGECACVWGEGYHYGLILQMDKPRPRAGE